MKKEMQQARVKSALCFLKYFGNSSDTEVTMVSMVANWGKGMGERISFRKYLLNCAVNVNRTSSVGVWISAVSHFSVVVGL